jgi:hypothetical protein
VSGSAPPREIGAVLRLLVAGIGLVYTVAFLSLAVQIEGLVGAGGILPNRDYFRALSEHTAAGFLDAPSLCWGGGCSDAALLALCLAGAAAGALLAIGAVPLPAALVAWVAYLSLFHTGQAFLSFQWDLLLLESGFLAILAVPPAALRPRDPGWSAPPRLPLWLFRWLLFRLMFASGVVKLASGDPTWRDLTALTFHYETQPIPYFTSWWAHQLPEWVQRASTAATLAIELGVPWLYAGPRRVRQAGAAVTVAFMALIGATGNYGFFNLLTAVLCASLLDDDALPARLRGWIAGGASGPERSEPRRGRRIRTGAVAAIATCVVAASLVPVASAFGAAGSLGPLVRAYDWQRGLHLANPYGLFASMTTWRPEISVEGSLDGADWRAYAFPWKPGDPREAPRFAGPHMPRLDWLLWFAALRGPEHSPWFHAFARRLLEGAPPVRALLAHDPFPETPPRRIRAVVRDYRFSDLATRRATGAWWEVGLPRVALVVERRPER